MTATYLTPAQRQAVHELRAPGLLVIALGVVFAALALCGALPSHLGSIADYADNVMFNSLCLGIVLCYLTLPPRRREAQVLGTLALVGEAARFASHPAWWDVWMRMQGVGYASGVVAMAGIAWRRLRSDEGDERLWAGGMLYLSLAMFLFPNISTWLHQVVIRATPQVYDSYAYRIDGAFGFEPAAVVYAFVHSHPLLHTVVFLTYNELPLMMIGAVLISLRQPEACHGRLMAHMILIGLAGMICYWVFPMKGEDLLLGAAFPHGPLPELPVTPTADTSDATRNCFPSLHLGWMLACHLGVRHVHPVLERLGLALVGLMVLATLNVAHYAVDLVGSFPYVVAFFGLINASRPALHGARMRAALGAGVLFAGYTALLMQAPAWLGSHPGALIALWGAVVGLSLTLERALTPPGAWRLATSEPAARVEAAA